MSSGKYAEVNIGVFISGYVVILGSLDMVEETLSWMRWCLLLTVLTIIEVVVNTSSEYLLEYILVKISFLAAFIVLEAYKGLQSKVK